MIVHKGLDTFLGYTGYYLHFCPLCEVIDYYYNVLSLANCLMERNKSNKAPLIKRLWACERVEVRTWCMLNRRMFFALNVFLHHLLRIHLHGQPIVAKSESSDIGSLALDVIAAHSKAQLFQNVPSFFRFEVLEKGEMETLLI